MIPSSWPRFFSLALISFILALLLALQMQRKSRQLHQQYESRQQLLSTLIPDLQRLDHYEAIELAIRDALQVGAMVPTLAAPLPAPAQHDLKRLPAVGEWRALQLNLTWPQVKTETALEVVSFYATNPPAWRIARLQIDALTPPGTSKLHLTLERVEANLE